MVAGAYIELHEELGRGGQGVVLRGTLVYASGPRREVAVKRLMPSQDVVYASDAVGRLRDEATALAALNHPAIPDFVALSAVGDDLALITRYVDGHDLSWVLDRGEFLGPRAAVEVVFAVADALDAALAAPGPDGEVLALVHRDVKPSNIRVDARGHVWLLDFGLARSERLERDAQTTKLGVVGSPSFIAPERARGLRATGATDVFSLGLVALELLGAPRALPAGWAPAGEPSLLSQEAWRDRLRLRLQELWTAPEGLLALLEDMLAWRPEQRPSVSVVRDRLGALVGTLDGECLRDWAAALPQSARSDASAGTRLPVRELSLDHAGGAGRGVGWRGVALGAGLGVAIASCGAFAPTYLGLRVSASAPPSSRAVGGAVQSLVGAPVTAAVTAADGLKAPSSDDARAELGTDSGLVGGAAGALDGSSTEEHDRTPPAAVLSPKEGATRVVRARPGVVESRALLAAPSPAASADAGQVLADAAGPDAPSYARWRSVSPQPVRLRRGDALAKPGAVEPGRWTVEADFGEGFVEAGDVSLSGGAEAKLACFPFLRLCEIRP